jgi:polar amino acid transport system substrate-binding protein
VKVLPARVLLSVRAITLSIGFAAALLAAAPQARAEQSPDAALAQLLEQARGALPAACTQPKPDSLTRILCSRRIRIGVRDSYPLFGTLKDGVRQGYEVDIARGIASRLGVEPEFVGVKGGEPHPDAGRGPHRPDHRDDGPQYRARP